jgi:hypothetical protein
MSEAKVRLGQVWKSKDRRDGERFVKVNTLAVESAWCVPCSANGEQFQRKGRRAQYIKFNTIRSRYELVTDSNGVTRE